MSSNFWNASFCEDFVLKLRKGIDHPPITIPFSWSSACCVSEHPTQHKGLFSVDFHFSTFRLIGYNVIYKIQTPANMTRKLSFSFPKQKKVFTAAITRIDRSKIYGDTRIEAFDEDGNLCEIVSIANDGQTLFGKGGIAFAIRNQDGEFVEKSALIPITSDGEAIQEVESSFDTPIDVSEKATAEDYLSHQVKSVYLLDDIENLADLKKLLKGGDIYKFPFSYRKGIIVDTAFLLANEEGDPFIIITTPSDFEYLGFKDSAPLDEEPDFEEESLFDFGSL